MYHHEGSEGENSTVSGVVTRNTLEAMVANLNLGPNNRPEGEDLGLRMGELG